MVKIREETLKQMIADRKLGATYEQIEQRYNVSRWASIKYLKDIKIEQGIADTLWKEAETKAGQYLQDNDFTHILNLNEITPQSHFDYYAEKGKDRWLIDVTLNEHKDLVKKSLRMVDGFRCGILYVNYKLTEFKLLELKEVN